MNPRRTPHQRRPGPALLIRRGLRFAGCRGGVRLQRAARSSLEGLAAEAAGCGPRFPLQPLGEDLARRSAQATEGLRQRKTPSAEDDSSAVRCGFHDPATLPDLEGHRHTVGLQVLFAYTVPEEGD